MVEFGCDRNTRRILRRDEWEQRVRAGKPSARLDYKCPLCNKWVSRYRGCDGIHRTRCEEKRAQDIAVRRGKKRARKPLRPPELGSTPIPEPPALHSPGLTPDPSIPDNTEWQDQQITNNDTLDTVSQQLEDILHAFPDALNEPPTMDGALASPVDDGDPGKSNPTSGICTYALNHSTKSLLR